MLIEFRKAIMPANRFKSRIAALLAILFSALTSLPQEQKPRKYALLFGVQNYPREVLGDLKHTENDVDELADWLRSKGGYDVVTVMTQTRAATKAELFPRATSITSDSG